MPLKITCSCFTLNLCLLYLFFRDILKQPSQKTCLRINKIYSPSALSWYPSAENLVLAVGGSSGNFGLWNIKVFAILLTLSLPHIITVCKKYFCDGFFIIIKFSICYSVRTVLAKSHLKSLILLSNYFFIKNKTLLNFSEVLIF